LSRGGDLRGELLEVGGNPARHFVVDGKPSDQIETQCRFWAVFSLSMARGTYNARKAHRIRIANSWSFFEDQECLSESTPVLAEVPVQSDDVKGISNPNDLKGFPWVFSREPLPNRRHRSLFSAQSSPLSCHYSRSVQESFNPSCFLRYQEDAR
jgi:hypothetical protein